MIYADLTPELERDLIGRYRAGDRDAALTIIDTFERMIAARVVRRMGRIRMDAQDAKQEIRRYILEAARRFDVTRGNRFLSYVEDFVHGSMCRTVARDTVIVVNPAADRGAMRAMKQGQAIPERLVVRLQLRRIASLDAPFGEGDVSLHDVVPGDVPGPSARVDETDAVTRLSSLASHVLRELTERERLVIESYIMSEEQPSLRELGSVVGVTYETVRNDIEKAMAKMRRAVRAAMTEDDCYLWGGKSKLPKSTAKPARASKALDEQSTLVLRALRRAGTAIPSDLVASVRGQASLDKVYKTLNAAEKSGLVQYRTQPARMAQLTRHYWLTDRGRAVLDGVTQPAEQRGAA